MPMELTAAGVPALLRIALGCALLVIALCTVPGARAEAPAGYKLSWSDEFDQVVGSRPSPERWTYDLGAGGWGNVELQTYVNDAEHAQVIADPEATDGQALRIRATKDAGNSYTSARIKTQGKAAFQYGYMEARIRVPYGQGIWPAFWMLGTDISTVGWPACGEIDIMENIGKEPGTVHGTLHGPGYSGGDSLGGAYNLPSGEQFKDAYHTFAARWRPDSITFYVDGTAYAGRTAASLPAGTPWVFNKPFFFIINLAVGGRWPGYPDASTVFPQDYRIDYVRVYEFQPPVGRTITLKSRTNNRYVTAGPDGAGALIASRTGAALSERFEVEDAGEGKIALRSPVNGRYVSVTGGAANLVASSESIGTAERFQWLDAGEGYIALRAEGTDRYVSAENAGTAALVANRTAVGSWECFTASVLDTEGLSAGVAAALAAAAGIVSPGPEEADRLDVETGEPSMPGVSLLDAVRHARRATGLDPLP